VQHIERMKRQRKVSSNISGHLYIEKHKIYHLPTRLVIECV